MATSFPSSSIGKMGVKPVVRFSDELFVEPLLASSGFVACDEEDCLALHVEGERDAPLTIPRAEAELFHIGVAGIVQSIDARTPQLRPELLQQPSVGKDFGPQVLGQFLKLLFELVSDFDILFHQLIMASKTYGVKFIFDRSIRYVMRISR
jgi:hypothetical protein